MAIVYGNLDTVKAVLEAGAFPDGRPQPHYRQNPPLKTAMGMGDLGIVQALLDKGTYRKVWLSTHLESLISVLILLLRHSIRVT